MKTVNKRRVISFGKIDFFGRGRRINEASVSVELRDVDGGPELSVCGEVWNGRGTDIVAGGQCLDTMLKYKELRTDPLFLKIFGLWKKYHLNSMHAGTPAQEAELEKWRAGRARGYDEKCRHLKRVGLYEDKDCLVDGRPYRYGSAWLYRAIPDDALAEIRAILDGENYGSERADKAKL